MSAVLRIGLVGAGPWGGNFRRSVERRDDAVIAAAATRDWETLAAQKLDGVIVATPPRSHLPIARRFG